MFLPKEIAVKAVVRRNVHYDRKSKELSTGIIKAKYKLAGTVIPGDEGILFWIFTSKPGRYPADKTVELTRNDYKWCKVRHNTLTRRTSFVCIERYDYMHIDDIYTKMCDDSNKFHHVAQIKESAFKKLVDLRPKLQLKAGRTVTELQQIIKATVDKDETYESILSSMGL